MKDNFREFYRRDLLANDGPSMIGRREFGFASFEGWMTRHRRLNSKEELSCFLRDSIPRDAYFSSAYYEDPEAEMERKNWLGADLVFDIDADHIPTRCNKVHDEWTCGDCGFSGRGEAPEKCPICGGERFDGRSWPCDVCLASAKAETIKLLDMLFNDFGFSGKEIRVFFSGHRGYHVHVENESIKLLDSTARKETVDYVSGLGLDMSLKSLMRGNRRADLVSRGLLSKDLGWRKRAIFGIRDFVLKATEEDFVDVGIRKQEAKTLLSNKESIARNLINTETFGGAKGVGSETWRKIVEHSVKTQAATVDTVVTTDIHRLIRLQGTLHGKTGFKKIEFPVTSIDDFDPFKGAIAFKGGSVTVFVSRVPEFRLGDNMFGPYSNQRVELPTAAAVLLVCRGRAQVVEQNVR